ncbi:hypothetical protein K438DRAFT_1768062 [Mycena galopus ATCC 62051]|nr:hypothetical protein K438DRAFT_1768062 [Mycena galopus ATCC 62051]
MRVFVDSHANASLPFPPPATKLSQNTLSVSTTAMGKTTPAPYATRNPGKTAQKSRRRVGPSDAGRVNNAIKKAESKQRREEFEDEIDAYFAFRDAEVSRIAKAFGKTDRLVRGLLCNKTQFKAERKPSLHNAIMHDRALKAKESGAKVLEDYQEDLREDVEDGTAVVDAASLGVDEVDRLMKQLALKRETERRGVRRTNKAAATDARQTMAGISRKLVDMRERTGVLGFCISSRGNADDPALPNAVDSGNALDFFADELKIPYPDVMRKFERWCVNRDNGEEEKQDIGSVRADVSRLVQDGLRDVKHSRIINMEYTHYDVAIREGLGVELAGWPADVPIERAATMTVETARRIRDGFKSGVIRWVVMTKTQREELAAEHNAKRAELGAGSLRKRVQRSDAGVPRGPRAKKSADEPQVQTQHQAEPQPQAEPQTQTQTPTPPMVLTAGAGTVITNVRTVAVTPNVVGVDGAVSQALPVFNTLSFTDPAPFLAPPTFLGPPAVGPDVPSSFTFPTVFPDNTFDASVPLDTDLDMDGIAREMLALGIDFSLSGHAPIAGDIGLSYLPVESPFPDSLRLPTPPPLSPIPSPPVLILQNGNKRGASSLEDGDENQDSEPPAKKPRKQRKDAGVPRIARNDENMVSETPRQRKKRSDAGVPRGPRSVGARNMDLYGGAASAFDGIDARHQIAMARRDV